MIPPWRRRRAVAVAGAALCGVVVAFVLIGNEGDDLTADGALSSPSQNGLAQARPPRTTRDLSKLRVAAASGQMPWGPAAAASPATPTGEPGDSNGDDPSDDDEDDAAATSGAGEEDVVDKPNPTPGKPAPGSLDKQAIQDAMKRMKPLIRGCYEEGLKHDPGLAGRVVIEFEISGEEGRGVVKQGTVADSEVAAPFFEACVLQKVSGLDAPAPEGGGVVKVRYPFTFDPGGGFGGEPAGADDEKAP